MRIGGLKYDSSEKLAELETTDDSIGAKVNKIMTGDEVRKTTPTYKIRHENQIELYKFIKSKFQILLCLITKLCMWLIPLSRSFSSVSQSLSLGTSSLLIEFETKIV